MRGRRRDPIRQLGTTTLAKRLSNAIDPFLIAMVATIAIATVLPARGGGLAIAQGASNIAVAGLFLLYGARLSFAETIAGIRHWRLHATVLAATFVLFPALGLAVKATAGPLMGRDLAQGLLYLTLVPSTVQSSIAFTAIARGNVPGAIVSASVSNVAGVFLTPLLVVALMSSVGTAPPLSADAVIKIAFQLLVPFVIGQLIHRWVGSWLIAHKSPTKLVERGSILLVIYAAFSAGMAQHIWSQVSIGRMVALLGACAAILGVVMTILWWASARLGFARADRIALFFCGSKKSLASGMPMAAVLFSASQLGIVVLPLMMFHQLQLLICGIIAPRLGRFRDEAPTAPPAA
ncbi:bile acid:sodium symporter [Rarobacter incanus]